MSLIEGNYKKVFVAGGTKGVGRSVVSLLTRSGVSVVALARSQTGMDSLAEIPNCTPVLGDAFNYKNVEDNMFGCDAVISTLGGRDPDTDEMIDYIGNSNCIEAAGILGITRFILITSIGCGSSRKALSDEVFAVLGPVLKEKDKAEKMLMKYYTNTHWTIIRPGGLKSEKKTGVALLTEDDQAIGSICREDVAELIFNVLGSGEACRKKVLSAVDPSLVSSVKTDQYITPFKLV